jgi:hypothetical protein
MPSLIYLTALEIEPDEAGYAKVMKRISQLPHENLALWKDVISRNNHIDKRRLLNAFRRKEETLKRGQKQLKDNIAKM